jgi:hypothetical protein
MCEMKEMGRAVKTYWWSVFLTLIGAFLVVSHVYFIITFIVPAKGYTYEPLNSGTIIGWAGVLAIYIVVLFGGASIMYTGISKIVHNLKSATRG